MQYFRRSIDLLPAVSASSALQTFLASDAYNGQECLLAVKARFQTLLGARRADGHVLTLHPFPQFACRATTALRRSVSTMAVDYHEHLYALDYRWKLYRNAEARVKAMDEMYGHMDAVEAWAKAHRCVLYRVHRTGRLTHIPRPDLRRLKVMTSLIEELDDEIYTDALMAPHY